MDERVERARRSRVRRGVTAARGRRARSESPLVSVVTPVRNGEEYLRQCIESVLAQTYEHWDYLIVDNRSTDRSLDIARGYAAHEPRIRVRTTDASLSRIENFNHTIHQLSDESQYCKVLHADDWMFPECLERMVELAEAHPSVGIVGSYRLEGAHVSPSGLPPSLTVISGRDLCRSTLLSGPLPYLFGSPTTLLIRSGLIRRRNPFYNVANELQADQEACYETLRDCDFGFVHQILTYTRRHDESGMAFYGDKLRAEYAERVILHLRFGRVYLAEREYERKLAVRIAQYAVALLRSSARWRDAAFREYHLKAVSRIRESLTAVEVSRGVLLQLDRMLRRTVSRADVREAA
jgi:glycosyltransferase involved in cell wall biosynthesis